MVMREGEKQCKMGSTALGPCATSPSRYGQRTARRFLGDQQ